MEPRHQPTFGWNSCPAEILYLVFKLLYPADLQQLCLVNKTFKTFAEPLLYSTIHFTWQEYHQYYSKLDPPPPITQLLRTLLSRPQLAAYITSLHLDGKAYAIYETRFKLPRIYIPNAELDRPIAFIRRTVPYSDEWIQKLRDGSIDALIALLLSQLPSLRYLYLGRAFTRQSTLIGMVLRSGICEYGTYNNKLPDFRYLREVSFLCRKQRDEACDWKTKNTADVLPLFYLPSLQCMSVSIRNPEVWTWPTDLPVPSKLTFLNLTSIREGQLGEILAVTQNLKTLRWEWYYDAGVADEFVTKTIALDQIASAISHVRDSLTDLTITGNCQPSAAVGDQFQPGLQAVGSLDAMASFNIRRLQIPLAFLVGFAQDTTKRLQDVIPRNIEFLTITDDLAMQNMDYLEDWPLFEWKDDAILELLQSWLKEWTICTPNLRRITLSLCWIDMDEWSPKKRAQLRDLGAESGILLELIDT
ncbi:hypothetical protein PHISCL_01025 [Aspergillus sclerotialis]|uniref:F-box domain-containing protein n=1 Tax=Aspergillus sclerotialis TaxID=2070753 RepID=A0A3A3AB64_9EURO|nr:hypothetical protein PHISCL_01025 [Aspergillus sclerotialis]